ncbi:ABC transporter permease [Lacrimispora sp. 38-1]|uniref:ABC transporter permease n=1 Tax=Lacrimispora sp. 38-1 TaxID=3125778 RepID=UPI003CF5F13D
MRRYIVKRLCIAFITLFIILTVAFVVVRLMPGSVYDDPNLSASVIAILEKKAHLNEPIYVQYWYFMKGILLENDWGTSVKVEPGVPAFQVLLSKMPVSLAINLLSLVIAIPLGMAAGILSSIKKNSKTDILISFGVILGISVPSFVFASLLQYILGYKLGWFSILYKPTTSFLGQLYSITLPVIALALTPVATITRYLRGELIEVLNSEYMTLARTKGLTQKQAILRHALRNSGIPMVNVIIPMFANVLGGSMVVERLFSIPGVGSLMIRSINANDHSLTIAILIFYAAISIATMLIVDLSYGLIDPRIRVGGKEK